MRALAALKPQGDAELQAILDLLGLGGVRLSPPQTMEPQVPAGIAKGLLEEPKDESLAGETPKRSGDNETRIEGSFQVERFEVNPVLFAEPVIPVEVRQTVDVTQIQTPLLRPATVRTVLSEMLGTNREIGRVDIGTAVRRVAANKPLGRLPRFHVRTLAHGCDVLVDLGIGLLPFTSDRRQVLAELGRVMGSNSVSRFYFVDCPLSGVSERPRRSRRPYLTTRRGRPVLAVTDLGLGRPRRTSRAATEADWVAFSTELRNAGCPLIALVPYPPDRWPEGLTKAMSILLWDQTLTCLDVRRALNDANRL